MVGIDRMNRSTIRTFGRSVTFLRANALVGQIRGIFDRRHYPVPSADGTAMVSTLITSLTVLDDDIGELDGSERFVIGGETYMVSEPKPDGQGMTALQLEIDEDAES